MTVKTSTSIKNRLRKQTIAQRPHRFQLRSKGPPIATKKIVKRIPADRPRLDHIWDHFLNSLLDSSEEEESEEEEEPVAAPVVIPVAPADAIYVNRYPRPLLLRDIEEEFDC